MHYPGLRIAFENAPVRSLQNLDASVQTLCPYLMTTVGRSLRETIGGQTGAAMR